MNMAQEKGKSRQFLDIRNEFVLTAQLQAQAAFLPRKCHPPFIVNRK